MLKNPERRPVDLFIPEKWTFSNPVLWTFYFPLDRNPLHYSDPSGNSPCDGRYADPECQGVKINRRPKPPKPPEPPAVEATTPTPQPTFTPTPSLPTVFPDFGGIPTPTVGFPTAYPTPLPTSTYVIVYGYGSVEQYYAWGFYIGEGVGIVTRGYDIQYSADFSISNRDGGWYATVNEYSELGFMPDVETYTSTNATFHMNDGSTQTVYLGLLEGKANKSSTLLLDSSNGRFPLSVSIHITGRIDQTYMRNSGPFKYVLCTNRE